MRGVSRLRTRLAVRAAAAAALALAVTAAAAEIAMVRPLAAELDEELARHVDAVASSVAGGGEAAFRRDAPAWIRRDRDEWFALRSGAGVLLATSGRSVPAGTEGVRPGGPVDLADPVTGGYRAAARTASSPGGGALVVVAGIGVRDLRDRQGEIRWMLVAACVGGVLLVAAGAWVGASLVLEPLGRMTEAARRLDADRASGGLAVPPAPDEFGDLARLLDGLLARVGGALEEERRFAGEAAHELRAPLSVLRIRVEEALASGDGEEMREALRGAISDVERIDRLVKGLLELSRAVPTAAAPGGAAPPLDAGEVLGALAPDLGTLGAARGVSFSFRPPSAPLRAAVPREVLETAVSVLVDNAFRYTPKGGSVALEAESAEGRLRVRVRDTGPGVPGDEAGRIFDRLFRGRAGLASGAGFGIGLALARRLARSAGGEVSLENPGAPGASFALDLPGA